ncbi:unnamed protein product [Leptidea sinapis]|uniref:Craniofacial development protein 1 n=1 Tax=Leptidea sinapis TaxID=189913 RepID=A0A5E4QZS4_9NEOP|nr:unnamed protein product [Leptidea sinapis]
MTSRGSAIQNRFDYPKYTNSNGQKRIKASSVVEEATEDELDSKEPVKPEEEKKREDDLWAKFLEGTDSKPKPKVEEPVSSTKLSDGDKKGDSKVTKQDSNSEKEREKRIFEFAGETIIVENNVIKDKIKTAEAPPSDTRGITCIRRYLKIAQDRERKLIRGLSSCVCAECCVMLIYLDRQDFLDRSEMRQYEIERDLRMNRRSKR